MEAVALFLYRFLDSVVIAAIFGIYDRYNRSR
jgi:hypothetical protein